MDVSETFARRGALQKLESVGLAQVLSTDLEGNFLPDRVANMMNRAL